jgi:glycosyltransferase involved in cell wall biosynthesis
MITVLHVIDELNGPNPWFNGILEHCDRSRFRHMFVTLKPRNDLQTALEERGAKAFSLEAPLRRQLPLASLNLARLIRREQVDIVQTHQYYPSAVALAATRVPGGPLVILTRHHANYTTLFNKPLHRRIDRWEALASDQVWSPSHYIKRCMVMHEGVPADHISVIPHGFDFDLIRPRLTTERRRALRDELGGDDRYLIGVIARLSVEKGHEHLFRAIPEVVRKHPKARFLLAGAGPRKAELEQMVAQLGIGEVVRFLGWRTDPWDVIEATDLIVHPSLHEPFGIVYVESLALGKTVITTGESGAVEIIDDGETGVIVPPGDTPALLDAMLGMLGDPERVRRLAAAGRPRMVERFSFPKVIKNYERHYESWLNGRSRPAVRGRA